jgi:pantoate--beta-alanine ligase
MVTDLNLGVQMRMLPTVREADGLAMSSRNRYLSAGERKQAAGIYQVLEGARQAVREGHRQASVLIARATQGLQRRGIRSVDYVQIVDGDTLKPLKDVRPGAVMAVVPVA